LGARLLPEVPKQTPGLHCGLLERSELGRSQQTLRTSEVILKVPASSGVKIKAVPCHQVNGFFLSHWVRQIATHQVDYQRIRQLDCSQTDHYRVKVQEKPISNR
jgi:hypothetical protein